MFGSITHQHSTGFESKELFEGFPRLSSPETKWNLGIAEDLLKLQTCYHTNTLAFRSVQSDEILDNQQQLRMTSNCFNQTGLAVDERFKLRKKTSPSFLPTNYNIDSRTHTHVLDCSRHRPCKPGSGVYPSNSDSPKPRHKSFTESQAREKLSISKHCAFVKVGPWEYNSALGWGIPWFIFSRPRTHTI